MVKEMMMRATDVLTDHMYCDRPQVRRRRAIWSMVGRFSMNNQNGYLSRLSNLRWRTPRRSIVDPPVRQRYLFDH